MQMRNLLVRRRENKCLHTIHTQAGLLVSAVRALATSATEEQRELEKQRLLSGHAETAAAIDHLVTKHQGELQVEATSHIMQYISPGMPVIIQSSIIACHSVS